MEGSVPVEVDGIQVSGVGKDPLRVLGHIEVRALVGLGLGKTGGSGLFTGLIRFES